MNNLSSLDNRCAAFTAAAGFLGSPLSGVLFGGFSTMASPILKAFSDLQELGTDIQGGDFNAVLTDLFNDPANIMNSFLNGYGNLPLTEVLSDLGITMPAGFGDISPTIDFGGLLSGGGSLFNTIGIDGSLGDCDTLCIPVNFEGEGVGPIAALIEMGQSMASGIGWDEAGSPLADLFNGLF